MPNVNEVTRQLREIIQDNLDLQDIWMYGKISEVRPTHNGTLNFTLTDSGGQIECVIFNDRRPLQGNLPPVGNNVFVKGQIYVYETRSRYRFMITDVNLLEDSSPQPFSISDLTNTLRGTLARSTGQVQGKIAKVFITPTDYTILNLKDITADEQTNDIIECALLPGTDSPFSLQQGDVITVEGKFDIFAPICAYRITIDNPNVLRRLSPVQGQQTSNECQECGQRCEQGHQFCPMCHYTLLDHEGIVVGAVVRYFNTSRFANFSIQREHLIKFGTNEGRADVGLLNSKGNPVAIAECKSIGYGINNGREQLESYLNASGTKFGLFADDTDPYGWTFLKRNDEESRYDEITRSQFEKELGVNPVSEMPPTQTRLELIRGNITKTEVDAIVITANPLLTSVSDVDEAIWDAGGEEIEHACQEIIEREGFRPLGDAVITTGGNLTARHIIHAVGPIYGGGGNYQAETLANCYKNSLRLAVEKGIRSIAFSAISTGNFGYPIEAATPIALNAVKEFVEQAQQNNEMVPERIQFVMSNEEVYNFYVKELSNLGFGLSCPIG